jgi:hypothetical protein
VTNPDQMPNPDQPANLPLRVTIEDLRATRYCLAGVRPWFRRHGLDWQTFLAQGIEVAKLRATNDALIDPVIDAAARREAAARTSTDEARNGRQ